MDRSAAAAGGPTPPPLTPTQLRTFDELLAVGGARPTCPEGLVEELRARILEGTAAAVERWTERTLFLTKGQLFTALRCEGQLAAEAAAPRTGRELHLATAVGIVSHRAIQITSTHPGRSIEEYVRFAVNAELQNEGFAAFWNASDPGRQSDLLTQSVSRVASFLDSWPPLDPVWTPRFEEPMQGQIGQLKLSARADLVLGRPKASMKQTMLLTDLKSGALHDHHYDEAQFYALVATIRHGVPPFRSTVYSLASGTYTEPDVTPDSLRAAAEKVIEGTNRVVDVLTERREIVLTAGDHCTFCPARATCPAYAALTAAPKPAEQLVPALGAFEL